MSTFQTLLVAHSLLATVVVVASFLTGLLTWELRRSTRGRFSKPRREYVPGRVVLYAPCKGVDLDLESNLQCLCEQDYPDYEICFVVESADDPACQVIRRVMARSPHVATRLVVAGRATVGAQKVHNLLCATAELRDDVVALAFVDSDVRARSTWLGTLVSRLAQPSVGAVTSYRWFVPASPSWTNLILASLNNGVMPLVSWRRHGTVWGGTWCVRRAVFERAGVRDQWYGQLSDDLSAHQSIRRAGYRVEYEPRCVVPSRINARLPAMFEFVRRQIFICRHYLPWSYTTILTATSLSTLAYLGGVVLALMSLWIAPLWGLLPVGWVATLHAMAALRAHWRHQAAWEFAPGHRDQATRLRRFDQCAYPAALVSAWIGLVSALLGRSVRWRGIEYRLQGNRPIEIVRRAA